MTCVFMAIHYPEPGRQADLFRRMAGMAESMGGVPGDTVHEWEVRPREYLHLTQPAR